MSSRSQKESDRQRAAVLREEERQRRADVAAAAVADDVSRQRPNQVVPPSLRQ